MKCRQSIVRVLERMVSECIQLLQTIIRAIFAYHQSMDTRVDQSEDKDGRSDVADTRPHAHHRTCMVVGL